MSLKPFVAVFSLLLLSACQPITKTSANAHEALAKEELVTNTKAQSIAQNRVEAQDGARYLSDTPLKQAIDVEQIDSLIFASADNNKASKETNTSVPPSHLDKLAIVKIEEPENLSVSNDPITLLLLERGAIALANQKLLTPEDDNANMYYQAALGREPTNKAAQNGLDEIVRFYTVWSLDKAKRGQNRNSNKYLEAASFVDVKNPQIAQTKQDIKDWRAGIRLNSTSQKGINKIAKGKQNKFYLPQNLFSYSEALVIQKLQPIIDRIEKDQLNIMIFWPNDKEARLLYQIINSRTEEFRVRGMIYRRAQHMIEVKQG